LAWAAFGLNVIQGARWSAPTRSSESTSTRHARRWRAQFGHDALHHPNDLEALGTSVVDAIVQLTDGGA
jgi:Zn-dependent alcohol dehydrogenase